MTLFLVYSDGAFRAQSLDFASPPELVMGHFFKTQPNPKFLDPTQPTKVSTQLNPSSTLGMAY